MSLQFLEQHHKLNIYFFNYIDLLPPQQEKSPQERAFSGKTMMKQFYLIFFKIFSNIMFSFRKLLCYPQFCCVQIRSTCRCLKVFSIVGDFIIWIHKTAIGAKIACIILCI